MSGRNLERLLARLDALGDQVRKDVDQIVCARLNVLPGSLAAQPNSTSPADRS